MRGTAPSSHWPISAPHAPTHQFASTKPLTKHTLHSGLDGIVRGGPDRRSPHFSTITTSHWLLPWASRYILLPQALPPPPPSVLIRRPPPYYPMPSTPPYPLPPFSHPQALRALLMVSPVEYHFRFGFIAPAYTGPVFHCLPVSPFRPSSVLLTSVGSTFIIPFCFFNTPPALRYPPYPPLPIT